MSVTIETTDGKQVSLSEQCMQILVYPDQMYVMEILSVYLITSVSLIPPFLCLSLYKFRREDITWICLQFWLLAISFLAILNDSVPHL